MKRIIFLLVISSVIGDLFAQQDNCECQSHDDYVKSVRRGLIGQEYLNPLKGYTGEQYFNAWTKGEVLLNDGERITDLDLRYERYLDELLWLRNGDFKSGILNKGEIAGFNLFNPGNLSASFVRVKIKLPNDDDSTYRYLQVLEPGKIGLYALRAVNGAPPPNEFNLVDNTKYLIFNSGHYEILRLKRKDLLALSVIDKGKMKSILRSDKIRINDNEPAMVRAVWLYNQQ